METWQDKLLYQLKEFGLYTGNFYYNKSSVHYEPSGFIFKINHLNKKFSVTTFQAGKWLWDKNSDGEKKLSFYKYYETELLEDVSNYVNEVYHSQFNKMYCNETSAFFMTPHYMKKEVDEPDIQVHQPDIQAFELQDGCVTLKDVAYRYFPRKTIKDGWSFAFETNVYGVKVAHQTRDAVANTLIINPLLFKQYNKNNEDIRGVNSTYTDYRYQRVILDDEMPLDQLIVCLDNLEYSRVLVTKDGKHAINPNVTNMGFILTIGDHSDHFKD